MWTAAVCFTILWIVVIGDAKPKERVVVAEKHASELDLNCDSYEDGVDWGEVRKKLFTFLAKPAEDHDFLTSLLALGRTPTDCYIGLCCLGYLAMIFMDGQKRTKALLHTMFGSIPLWDQIPLSYWDTIHSRWPIFGLLEIVGALARKDPAAAQLRRSKTMCCDYEASDVDPMFQQLLAEHLDSGATLAVYASIRFLAQSFSRCSFGKSAAYLALAERLLQVESPVLTQASKDFMALGEAQLDRCAVGRNVTVSEQMMSEWPFWALLKRVEADGRVKLPSEKLRTPPAYFSPSLRPAPVLHHPDGARLLHVASQSPSQQGSGEGGTAGDLLNGCEVREVHVALSGDGRHMEGLLAVIQSVILGTKSAQRICVHVFVLQIELKGLVAALRCSFQTRLDKDGAGDNHFVIDGVAIAVHTFSEAEVLSAELVVDASITVETGDLNAPHNFVRFYLGRWIKAGRIIYLDTDVIVKGDVCELHDLAFTNSKEAVLSAVPRRHLPLSFYLKIFSPKMPGCLQVLPVSMQVSWSST